MCLAAFRNHLLYLASFRDFCHAYQGNDSFSYLDGLFYFYEVDLGARSFCFCFCFCAFSPACSDFCFCSCSFYPVFLDFGYVSCCLYDVCPHMAHNFASHYSCSYASYLSVRDCDSCLGERTDVHLYLCSYEVPRHPDSFPDAYVVYVSYLCCGSDYGSYHPSYQTSLAP